MKKLELNIKLLRQVALAIKKHHDQFEMTSYFSDSLDLPHIPDAGGCGTAACIAGWTCHIALNRNAKLKDTAHLWNAEAGQKATDLLGLSPTQRERLFLAQHWPEEYSSKFFAATKSAQQAAAAAERIEHLIKYGD